MQAATSEMSFKLLSVYEVNDFNLISKKEMILSKQFGAVHVYLVEAGSPFKEFVFTNEPGLWGVELFKGGGRVHWLDKILSNCHGLRVYIENRVAFEVICLSNDNLWTICHALMYDFGRNQWVMKELEMDENIRRKEFECFLWVNGVFRECLITVIRGNLTVDVNVDLNGVGYGRMFLQKNLGICFQSVLCNEQNSCLFLYLGGIAPVKLFFQEPNNLRYFVHFLFGFEMIVAEGGDKKHKSKLLDG